ncbi:MAG TPA: YCF48-related protein [Myxococcales bacterium]|nr:YCF48-related protein [Myxococcales bacterium]
MRRAVPIVLRLAALAFAAPARAGDAFVDPLDAASSSSTLSARRLLNAAVFAGGRIVAAGQRGHVVFSDDKGKTWTQAEVPVSSDLTALSFPSSQRGWAVGHDGVVLATTDGGRSWTRQLDGRGIEKLLEAAAGANGLPGAVREQLTFLARNGSDQPLLDVWFDDERNGTAVGAFNLILRTVDGGATWTPWLDRTDNPKALHLYSVRRVAGALWIAGEQGLVLRLDPATGRFLRRPTPYAGSFFGVAGSDRAVLVFGLRGHVLRSRDQGTTWQAVDTGLEVALTGGARAPDGRLLLVSASGQVLLSRNDGESFSALAGVRPLPTSAVASDGSTLALTGVLGARVETLPR